MPSWYAGAPVMVLETVGRRSGQKRATPVLYLRDGERDRVWWAFVEMYPQAGHYARFTDRVGAPPACGGLPLVALEPAGR